VGLNDDPKVEPMGGELYALVGEFDRFYADALLMKLRRAGIPARIRTPFEQAEAYTGVYTGMVSLWVPQALYERASAWLERDAD